jgi:hypothetical protein
VHLDLAAKAAHGGIGPVGFSHLGIGPSLPLELGEDLSRDFFLFLSRDALTAGPMVVRLIVTRRVLLKGLLKGLSLPCCLILLGLLPLIHQGLDLLNVIDHCPRTVRVLLGNNLDGGRNLCWI